MSTRERKEEYFFRIIDLAPPLAELVENEIKVMNFKKKYCSAKSNYVVSFPITEGIEQEKIQQFLNEHKISDLNYGIFAELTTNKDIDGLEFPDFVVRLHKLVG